jgi:hypothetical protein
MQYSCGVNRRLGTFLGVAIAASVLAIQVQPAQAQTTEEKWTVTTATSNRGHAGKSYFIEFRGRAAANYGHMNVLYGRVNARDEIVASRIAGLHPAGDAADCYNCSLLNWTVGHLVPVRAETGASDGDLEEKYVTARYRVWMTAAQYKDVDAYIRKLQADNPTWNALFNNCVGFGRNIAEHMGLKLPAALWIEPEDFVNGLRELNGPKAVQLPLRDAGAGSAAHAAASAPLPPSKPATAEPASSTQPASKPTAVKKKPVASAPQAKPDASASESEGSSAFAGIFKREQKMSAGAAQ